MEKKTRELESLVSSQKEQLSRYEKRLKDVVTAYKGLLKEKEALEASLAAFTTNKDNEISSTQSLTASAENDSTIGVSISNTTLETIPVTDDDKNHLHTQIITLMNSLATLSAEKSRMEASFQADKKHLRSQIAQKDQNINELQIKIKENELRAKNDVDEIRAKWLIERQDREKETNNQMLMIRELQKLYADERHLKENIEMQLNNFKTQFASNEAENGRFRDLQTQLKEAKNQLKQMQTNGSKQLSAIEQEATSNSVAVLQQVQQEMQQLKEQHAVAIKSEQLRVLRAEEQSRKQAALHEGRVANLEARLAELSNTVGTYDRLRQQDQDNILTLKQQLQDLENKAATGCKNNDTHIEMDKIVTFGKKDIGALVNEIVRLKKMLQKANGDAANPIDLTKILTDGTDHTQCHEDLRSAQEQLAASNAEIKVLSERVEIQKSHIVTLQDKVKVLNRNIDETELELKQQNDKLRHAVKDERTKWQAAFAELENETRCKINELEQQLQKQRQRSLHLLDEKEQEIKALQTSFEVFHNVATTANKTYNDVTSSDVDSLDEIPENNSSGNETIKEGNNDNSNLKFVTKTKKLSLGENCHMLHYANELARKEIEIATLRKSKYAAETSLRHAIQEKVAAQEELNDKIALLEEEVDRLKRCKTREGANLEYLKNVIISYIVTKDAEGKRHMLNAISAVLQFTNAETQTINGALQKK